MKIKNLTVKHQDKSIAVCISLPDINKHQCGILLTHGAGGDMHVSQLEIHVLSTKLAEEGFTVVRFTCKSLNIVYRQRVFTSVMEWFLKEKDALGIQFCFIGGRSMGSRAAVMCCSTLAPPELAFIRGVICLAYPLHPPKDTDSLRSQPLIDCPKPVLLVSGTKDEMATVNLLENVVLESKGSCKMYWVSDADHSHKVRGRKENEVCQEIFDVINQWISEKSKMNHCNVESRTKATENFSNDTNKDEKKHCVEKLPNKRTRSSRVIAKKQKR